MGLNPKGKPVLDIDNVELGTVAGEEEEFYEIIEGPLATFLLQKSLVKVEEHKVFLLKPVTDLLEGREVVDSEGVSLGIVEEVLAPDKELDCFIVRTLEDEFLYVTPEDVARIGDRIELEADSSDVAFANRNKSLSKQFRMDVKHDRATKKKRSQRAAGR